MTKTIKKLILNNNIEDVVNADYIHYSNVIVLHDGRVLLLLRKTDPFKDMWSIPGGGVEAGESFMAAARRELYEETGKEADDLRPLFVYVDSEFKLESHIYLHQSKDGSLNNIEQNEHTRLAWVDIDEALKLQLTPGLKLGLETIKKSK